MGHSGKRYNDLHNIKRYSVSVLAIRICFLVCSDTFCRHHMHCSIGPAFHGYFHTAHTLIEHATSMEHIPRNYGYTEYRNFYNLY